MPIEKLIENKTNSMKYLALGDSYTIGELVEEKNNFPNQLTKMLKQNDFPNLEKPLIIAKTGWTSNNLFQAILSQKPHNNFDFVTLLIGVNDQYQTVDIKTYEQNFLKLLIHAILFAKGQSRRVFVLSIPDWSVTPFAEEKSKTTISKQINEFNKKNKVISLAYRCHYLDITVLSRQQGNKNIYLAKDKLHYSPAAYQEWAKTAEPFIAKQINDIL